MLGFIILPIASRTCSAVGGCGLCGLGVWHLAPFGQQAATRIWGIQPRRFVRFLLVVLINTHAQNPLRPPGWSRGVSNTWSPPSSFCQRSDTRRRSHGTDDGAESGRMRGNTAMAMRLCCRDVQAPLADRRGCARKKKGRNAAPNLHDFVKDDPRSRALDWPSGRETTLDQDSLRTQWLSHLFQLPHLSLLITSHLSANTLVPQKAQWGQRVGGVVGKPEAHGGRFRVGGQCLGHRLDRAGQGRARTHAPGPGMGACQLRGTDSDELPGRQSISCCSYRRRTVGKGPEWTETETANDTFLCCSCRGTTAHSLLSHACHRWTEEPGTLTKTDRSVCG